MKTRKICLTPNKISCWWRSRSLHFVNSMAKGSRGVEHTMARRPSKTQILWKNQGTSQTALSKKSHHFYNNLIILIRLNMGETGYTGPRSPAPVPPASFWSHQSLVPQSVLWMHMPVPLVCVVVVVLTVVLDTVVVVVVLVVPVVPAVVLVVVPAVVLVVVPAVVVVVVPAVVVVVAVDAYRSMHRKTLRWFPCTHSIWHYF